MSSRVRAHIRDNVVAYIALFFALSGVAWAAHTAPKNSVATKSIKNGAVTTDKLANGAVTGSKADLTVLQHRLDGGCGSGEAIQSVNKGGHSTCDSFLRGSGQSVLLDNALTTATSPVTVADLGFISFEAKCSDNGVNTGTIELTAHVPSGGQTHLIYQDPGNGTVTPTVVNPDDTALMAQVSNGYGKVEFSVGNGGYPGAGSGDVSGTVYLNASFQNSTGTCNDLGFILSS